VTWIKDEAIEMELLDDNIFHRLVYVWSKVFDCRTSTGHRVFLSHSNFAFFLLFSPSWAHAECSCQRLEWRRSDCLGLNWLKQGVEGFMNAPASQ
jgi:hypothetical protein